MFLFCYVLSAQITVMDQGPLVLNFKRCLKTQQMCQSGNN